MSGRVAKARRLARIVAAVAMIPPHVAGWALAKPFGREHRWTRAFLGATGRRLSLKVTTEGQRLTGPVLFVSNHVSWLDILALGGATGPTGAAFVSRGDVQSWPLIGFLAKVGGTIFIDRERRSIGQQTDALTRALASGRPAMLFPEGTTGDGKTLLPFRAALFGSVAGGNVPIQPVAIDYGPAMEAIAWGGDEGFGPNAGRVLLRDGKLPVTVRFLAPIDPAGLDRKQLAAKARDAIANALGMS
ncbi:lysophospholipid acyltransferase family protein [Sphingomonas naphthae]|uniref:Lysophospholipid acyltransferase family protein n=1 Tax=Sphingomonas naphthae TaxID=1813468 RepID=A0ABY7TGC3_9SPHN|nr:lysophospholipid acyltransferase family protein [Sphingomonas naphthae]WCT72272.1 lysophospholipid acyltransferase family protein [Sphingomonas naphthae]